MGGSLRIGVPLPYTRVVYVHPVVYTRVVYVHPVVYTRVVYPACYPCGIPGMLPGWVSLVY